MSNLVQQQQQHSQALLTTADLQSQVTSYQAQDYDDAIQKCHDWHGLDKAAKQHFLYQALIKGSEEGVSRNQVFLDLPEGFVSNGTFYNWIKQAPDELQAQFPTASAAGRPAIISKVGNSEEEPAAIADFAIQATLTEPTTTMPVPTQLDQTTFPDGSVVDNLEAAYEAPAALQAASANEESEKAAVDAPKPVSGVSRVEDLTTLQLVTELIKRRGEFPGGASGHVFDGLQYWEAKLKALPVEVKEDDLVENWL